MTDLSEGEQIRRREMIQRRATYHVSRMLSEWLTLCSLNRCHPNDIPDKDWETLEYLSEELNETLKERKHG